MKKILKSEYDTCIKVLSEISGNEDFITRTIGHLKKVDVILDIMPDQKTKYIYVPLTNNEIERYRVSRFITLDNEKCAVIKKGTYFDITHFRTGAKIISSNTRETLKALIIRAEEILERHGSGCIKTKSEHMKTVNN